ncbi:RagB/SusD family nutrient uptake outer membrane protein [Tenacibaculum aiptasiae]|uniref:RagB/SusD family nutrient uptake outer membrane protein n=1 Tax=Tenacibaculum aiptasiae TaxID=426481 RepID=A0A7J5ACA3_9FLAO|nr:RagB/SusD family nutrient uptake outer membrane protein [Tenacibaculum aiptasiae]KAB1155206.1 RagB/SusD family nutrient uptake outer membrane protein [Tenacibaculum aiptasiae]
MKKISLKITLLFLTIISFVGCNDKLDLTDPTTLGVDQFITDYASARTAMARLYDNIQTYGTNQPVIVTQRMVSGLYADELRHSGSFPTFTQALVNNILVDNISFTRIFAGHYNIINRATIIIRTVPGVADLSSAQKEELIAEAKAVRAWSYFQLVKIYGGLPIIDKVFILDGNAARDTPRSSEADVYSYIAAEIASAKGKLSSSNSNIYFTNDALSVLEAEVHLFMGNYNLAEPVLQSLIGKYTLDPNYANLFALGNTSSSTIFRINYNASDSNSLAFNFTPTGRLEVAPSQALLNSFETGDTRKNLIANNTIPLSAYINKYTDNAEGKDLPYIYRYADVILMYAEVLARKNDANALTYINMIRSRASLPALTTFDSSNVVDVIARERNAEFFGEGKRWEDVKRLGLAQTVIGSKTGITFAPKMLLWPIPQDELDANGAISQADQNPGY